MQYKIQKFMFNIQSGFVDVLILKSITIINELTTISVVKVTLSNLFQCILF